MPRFLVTRYELRYNLRAKRPQIFVTIRVGQKSVVQEVSVLPGHAVFVADMLRNEKPLFLDMTAVPGTHNLLMTSKEIPGEEET